MGKHTQRWGKTKGGQPTDQTPRARPRRASKEIGDGKADRKTANTPVEGKGTAGDDLGYNPTLEDICLWEVYIY